MFDMLREVKQEMTHVNKKFEDILGNTYASKNFH